MGLSWLWKPPRYSIANTKEEENNKDITDALEEHKRSMRYVGVCAHRTKKNVCKITGAIDSMLRKDEDNDH